MFLLASPALAGSADANYLIVPGVGIGPVRLGMTVRQVRAALGIPAKVDRDARAVWYTWRDTRGGPLRSLAVEAIDDLVVLVSAAHDERYRTREGIGAGDTADAVRVAFGPPSGVLHLPGYDMVEYKARGVTFVLATGGGNPQRVTGVVVAAHL